MTKILIYDKSPDFGEHLEAGIKIAFPEISISKVLDINSLSTSIKENTKLILLNFSGKNMNEKIIEETIEQIILEIKEINNKIAIILLTTESKGNVPEKIESQISDIHYLPYSGIRYIDIIKEHLNS